MIAQIIPGLRSDRRDRPRRKQEFQIAGRTFHEPTLHDADRQGEVLRPSRCRRCAATERKLRLMTVRSEGQFNTVVYEERTSTAARIGAT